MLSGILGAAELLAERLGDDQKNQRFTKMIIQTAEKAAQLTGKLLVFSRKGSFVSEPTDMHRIVNEAVDIFKHSFDRRISVICHLDAEKPVVLGDPGQLQNAIMNLGINSRDAMPHGGEIVISSHNEVLDDDYCASSQFNLSPGPHLVISVKDNGSGMPKEVISKIFEPFFTTKQQGKGTGLGLAAVYGAIRDHRGAITAYSEVGTGSEFHLYLPIINADDEHASDQSDTINHGGGCVLLVDDEEVIRNTTEAMLESIGYEVMTAADGQEATEIYYKYIHKINVVILDVVMPRMNGEDAFREIRKINPAAKVIISSGFTQDTMIKQLDKEGLNAFIKKPYRKAKLAQTLAEVLAPGNRP
jgi:CheY-like chemotaxis protein